MLLKEMIRRGEGEIKGEFQTYESRLEKASNGARYLRFGLHDESGKVRAHGWEERYRGPQEIPSNQFLRVTGRLITHQGHWIADIAEAEIVSDQELNNSPVVIVPESQIQEIVANLTLQPLREFSTAVLDHPLIGNRFRTLPASRNHHHSWPGGLLAHSLEVAADVFAYPNFHPLEREVGVVAALFHDIGKTKTFHADGRSTATGWVAWHDQVTLEILAPFLSNLERNNKEVATALRHLWLWLGSRPRRQAPMLAIGEAILAADHISAHKDVQHRAFSQRPHSHRVANFHGRRYFRLKN